MNVLVEITGGTVEQRKLLGQAVQTFAKKLLSDSTDLNVSISLIRDLYIKQSVKGDMLVIDDDEDFPCEFEIRLDSAMHNQALIRALAHEMVHVKQYAVGELRDINAKTVRWRGKKHQNVDATYWDQPWEIEAYGKELGLLEHFVKVRKYTRKRWYRDLDYGR